MAKTKPAKRAQKRYHNPVMSESQFKKEMRALRKIHSLTDHKKEQKVLKEVKKVEWLKIPSDKELKVEIDRLKQEERKAGTMLNPVKEAYEPLPSSKEILKKEKRKKR